MKTLSFSILLFLLLFCNFFSAQLFGQFPSILDLGSIDSTMGFSIKGIDPFDFLGSSISSAGDFNGDGIDDFMVGAEGGDSGNIQVAGEVYVIFGTDSGFPTTFDLTTLNGSNGVLINGVSRFDAVGSAVGSLADFNGDGLDDIIIGAALATNSWIDFSGDAYVVFGSQDGFDSTLNLSDLNGSNGFRIEGFVYGSLDLFGISVGSAGDINGDNISDLFVAAQGADPNGITDAGEVYVIYGSNESFDPVLNLPSIDSTMGFRIPGPKPMSFLGSGGNSSGDINGDGLDDLIMGTSAIDFGDSMDVGEVYVLYGKEGNFPLVFDLLSLDGSNGFRIRGLASDNRFGHSLAANHDINGDGIQDLVVGAPKSDPLTRNDAGEVYIIYGNHDGFDSLETLDNFSMDKGFRVFGKAENDSCGFSVSSSADLNGDGIGDIIIGSPRADPNGIKNVGESYVIYGQANNLRQAIDLASMDSTNGFLIQGKGSDVHGIEDINHDGVNDLILGAPGTDFTGLENAGEVHVIFGNDGRATSIFQENHYKKLFAYPNPSSNYIWIDMEGKPALSNLSEVSLFDYSGKKLDRISWKKRDDRLRVDVSPLFPGVYLLKVNIEGSLYSTIIMKK